MAKKIICPECKREVESNVTACPNCGFDIYLYVSEYKRIYDKKVAAYDGAKNIRRAGSSTIECTKVSHLWQHKHSKNFWCGTSIKCSCLWIVG